MPPIALYMSRQPWTIRKDATMAQAHRVMREHRIRHLPVLEGGVLVGIVTERDLHLIETLPGSDPDEVAVEEAMTVDVYAVTTEAPTDRVVENMAKHKYGSAIVLDRHGRVEGIFTTIDALQAMADLLRHASA
jgi:acetoin utilization protein AcuB